VKVGNKVVRPQEHIYAILNKPRGYICTADDERGRRTIFELLPRTWPRVSYVGRLDKESEGLLIITNDGELSLKLTHPRFKIDKEYEVTLDKPFDPALREKLLHGIHIEGGWAKAEQVTICGPKQLKIVLRQGLKRQIRLMLYALEYEVVQLARVRIGSIRLDIHPGEWRLLTAREVELLRTEEQEPTPRAPRRPSASAGPRPRSAVPKGPSASGAPPARKRTGSRTAAPRSGVNPPPRRRQSAPRDTR
jgi:23S rRNA pseudouridine2605 synthase